MICSVYTNTVLYYILFLQYYDDDVRPVHEAGGLSRAERHGPAREELVLKREEEWFMLR